MAAEAPDGEIWAPAPARKSVTGNSGRFPVLSEGEGGAGMRAEPTKDRKASAHINKTRKPAKGTRLPACSQYRNPERQPQAS